MKEKHLRLQLRSIDPLISQTNREPTRQTSKPVTAVWFNQTQTLPAKVRLAYRLVTYRYQGQARVQLMIEACDLSP